MSDRYHLMGPNMVGITGNVPQIGTSANSINRRKRKAIALLDTACGSRVTTYQLIAPKPDISNLQFTGTGELFGRVGEPETQESSSSSCQRYLTLLGAIPTNGASVKSDYIPTSDALSSSIPVLNTGEARFTDHSVSGELQLDRSAPQPWGFLDGSTDASGRSPKILSLQVTHSDRQLPEQGWTQDTASPLVTCPWRSHLEMIMSIDLALTNGSQRESSTAGGLLLTEDVKVLLVKLKRSYFKLKESVQHPKRFSKDTHQDGQPGHLDSVY